MNGWRSRLTVVVILWGLWSLHRLCTDWVPNSDLGMLVFHGSAAACDLLMLLSLSNWLRGRLYKDLRSLCLVSMIGNFAGWLAYVKWAPPSYYDNFMWGLGIAQCARLLWADNAADFLGVPRVHRDASGGCDVHAEKG